MDAQAQAAQRGVPTDHAIDQDWRGYTPDEHRVWSTLYARQAELLGPRACGAFLRGLDALDLHSGGSSASHLRVVFGKTHRAMREAP